MKYGFLRKRIKKEGGCMINGSYVCCYWSKKSINIDKLPK